MRNTIQFVKRMKPFLSGIWISYYNPVANTVGYGLAQKRGTLLHRTQDNRKINYIDDNLTQESLTKAKAALYEAFYKGRGSGEAYEKIKKRISRQQLVLL